MTLTKKKVTQLEMHIEVEKVCSPIEFGGRVCGSEVTV